MASQMTDRLDTLYVLALDRDASLMHANAVSACSRWAGPKTTHAEMEQFIRRQIGSLEGLNDSLSNEIRASWQWLADALGTAPVTVSEPARQPVRLFRFAGRRERGSTGATPGVTRGQRVPAGVVGGMRAVA